MITPPPELLRISDYARYHAERTPAADALVLGNDRISYAALADAIDALACALLASGVRTGDRVATLQTPCPDFFIAFLATASIGAIWVGLNPRHGRDELAYVLGDARPKVLIARRRVFDRDFTHDLAAVMASEGPPERLVLYDEGPPIGGSIGITDFLAVGAAAGDATLSTVRAVSGGQMPCAIVYTSGSTGQPKGALLHHTGIIGFSRAQNGVWPVSPLRVLNFLPISHIGCLIDISAPALIAGGTIVFQERFDPAGSLRLMETERITLWGSVPTVLAMQLAEPTLVDHDLSAVQLIVWEGATASEELIARLLAFGVPLATNYGLTEAGSGGTIVEPTRDPDSLTGIGAAFPEVILRLAGEDGSSVTDGETGEVQLLSPYLMKGYWNRPEATEAAFTRDGFLRTGDLAVRRPGGDYRIVGRSSEMYKSGGYNIYPLEIEAVIAASPAASAVAVVGCPDQLWQEIGVAFVVLETGFTVDEVATWCRDKLANYKRPKHFFAVDALPLLPIGKVDRAALKRRAAIIHSGEQS